MKRAILLLTIVVFLTACNEKSNRQKINSLDVGMTKIEVLEIMGDPYRREAQRESEWLMYKTNEAKYLDENLVWVHNPDSFWLTPLYFENGKLVGWGSNYWENKAQKFDIMIDQK